MTSIQLLIEFYKLCLAHEVIWVKGNHLYNLGFVVSHNFTLIILSGRRKVMTDTLKVTQPMASDFSASAKMPVSNQRQKQLNM